jgi:transposase
LVPIINHIILTDSIVNTDTRASYNALGISDFHRVWINRSGLFADRNNHTNGIENFWNYAK